MHDLILKAQNGDQNAMAELIKLNSGLIFSIVRRFKERGVEEEDLYQMGVLGFIKAVKRFDMSLNNQLSTYAVSMMMGEIRRFFRDDGIIKVSRRLKEISAKVTDVRKSYMSQHGIELSLAELSDITNYAKEDIILALEATSYVESLDKPITKEDDSYSLYQKIENPVNEYELLLNHLEVKKALDMLNDEEKKVIIFRYYRELTQNQIAQLIGTSQVQVSRIEKRALEKMRIRL